MPRVSPAYAGHRTLVAFGQSIRDARTERGLSQEELAHRAGIDRSYMSSIERGAQNLGLMTMHRLAETLDTTLAELLVAAKL